MPRKQILENESLLNIISEHYKFTWLKFNISFIV